jgi:hypothetical protein
MTTYGFTQSTVSVTGTAATLVAADSDRKYLLIQNKGDGSVFINFTTTATTANGVEIEAGQSYEPEKVPSNAISAISDSTASVILIVG